MRAREFKGPQSTDLLVCFPSRSHLSLMPARPSESSTLHHRRRRSLSRGGAHGSPVSWAEAKHNNEDLSEPNSPKVTCAGKIKVRTKNPNSCKNWQSVMEEIEKMHENRKRKKRMNWVDAFGLKKDAVQFLTCLRNIRFDFRCFGSVAAAEITSDEEEEEDTSNVEEDGGGRRSFSKWFVVLEEENLSREMIRPSFDEGLVVVDDDDDAPCAAAPANALLLMRCRSAPAKRWVEEREEEGRERIEKAKCMID